MTRIPTHIKGFSTANTLIANTNEAIQSGHQREILPYVGRHERRAGEIAVHHAVFGEAEVSTPTLDVVRVDVPPTEVAQIIDSHIDHKQ